jgi:hypothetical protein
MCCHYGSGRTLVNALSQTLSHLQAEKSSREASAEAEARAARLEAKTRSQADDLEAAAEKVVARSVAV